MSVPSDDVINKQSMVRVAAVTLMAYDFLRSLPAERRFARRTTASGNRWSRAFLLYMGLRYTTVVDITLSTIGFFSGALANEHQCFIFIFFVRYLRCVTASFAAAILAWRTWAICQRSRALGWVLAVFYVIVAGVQIWSQSYSLVKIGPAGQCFASNPEPHYAVAFYCVNLAFDLGLAALSSRQLWHNSRLSNVVQPFTATLLKEGLMYYVVCSAANVCNLVLWNQSPSSGIQSVGSNLGIVVTSIMAQMLLLSLQEITVVRDASSEEQVAQQNRRRKFPSRLSSVFARGRAREAGHATTGSQTGELSVNVHVDVLHTFDDTDEASKERVLRPTVRNTSEGDEKRGAITYTAETESEKAMDLELGMVSPKSTRSRF